MSLHIFVVTVLLGSLALGAAPATTQATGQFKVMSFNLRYSKANDGDDNWPNRREMLVRAIKAFDPDLLGTQECLVEQADYLQENLKGYGFAGVGRDDGKRKGEYAALMYRSDRFELVDSGNFWLSETPEKVGSKGWDADAIRIVSWVKLRDRTNAKSLAWLNTHWDHKGQKARLESAGLMRKWIEEHAANAAALITGDFNTHLDAAPYARMFDEKEWKRHLTDSYQSLHANDGPRANGTGSYHGFTGKGTGVRIDWIICSDEFAPISSEIDHYGEAGKYPSDHFPVSATIRWR